MKLQNESYSIDASDPSFVRIDYFAIVSMHWGPRPDSASIWFERANLSWLVSALRDCIDVCGLPAQRTNRGNDSLRVDASGPEPAPFIGIFNKRPPDVPHEGAHLIQLTEALAEKLLAELERLT